MTPLSDWLRLLIFLGVFGGLAVWILAGHYIARWWRRSPTVDWLRWQIADGYHRCRIRRLRKRPKTTKDTQ